MPKRTIEELFLHTEALSPIPTLDISGIVYDSRQAKPGDLFVALQGMNVDGHDFIPAAVDNGAAAVVGTKLIEGLGIPYIRVREGRH